MFFLKRVCRLTSFSGNGRRSDAQRRERFLSGSAREAAETVPHRNAKVFEDFGGADRGGLAVFSECTFLVVGMEKVVSFR